MANILLLQQNQSDTLSIVSKNWVYNFVQHHSELKTYFNWRYNHQYTLCKNSSIIQGWFDLIQKTIEQYKIVKENIYNFDETGFAISMIATARVITQNSTKGL